LFCCRKILNSEQLRRNLLNRWHFLFMEVRQCPYLFYYECKVPKEGAISTSWKKFCWNFPMKMCWFSLLAMVMTLHIHRSTVLHIIGLGRHFELAVSPNV